MRHMRIITKIAMLMIMAFHITTIKAQPVNVTYNHEPDIMNQFTVMETGAGSLQPRDYYQLRQKSYQYTAAETNKIFMRLENQGIVMKEVPLSEKVDSDLVKRAKVEAENIAMRTPGAADVAWTMEKGKIEGKMSLFQTNISKIISSGGTRDDYEDWKGVYDCLNCAIKLIRNSYLDLGSRKKEYLAIYKDIVRKNYDLTKQLMYWKGIKDINDLTSKATKINRLSSITTISQDAFNRWHTAMAVDGISSAKARSRSRPKKR